MRPVTHAMMQSICKSRPILLLNVNLARTWWFLYPAFSLLLTSPDGKKLPKEIWDSIRDSLILDFKQVSAGNTKWWLVLPEEGGDFPNGAWALRPTSVAVAFEHGQMYNSEIVERYEDFLSNPLGQEVHERGESSETLIRTLKEKVLRHTVPDYPHRSRYSLILAKDSTTQLDGGKDGEKLGIPAHAALYIELDVPDIIATIHKGKCDGPCGLDRTICPGCTGGWSQQFGAFMSCGVDLACPLCMGLPFCWKDMGYLRTYLRDDPPVHKRDRRQKRFDDRLLELGYPPRQWADEEDYYDDAGGYRTPPRRRR